MPLRPILPLPAGLLDSPTWHMAYRSLGWKPRSLCQLQRASSLHSMCSCGGSPLSASYEQSSAFWMISYTMRARAE